MRITYTRPPESVAFKDRCDHGAAHSGKRRGFLGGFVYGGIGLEDAFMQNVRRITGWIFRRDILVECLDCHVAGHITSCMSTHSIRDDDKCAGIAFSIDQVGDQEGIFLIITGTVYL